MASSRWTAFRLAGVRLLTTALLGFGVVSTVYILSALYTPDVGTTNYPSISTVVLEQYPQYVADLLRFEFGATERLHTDWPQSGARPFNLLIDTPAVGSIIANHLPMSVWVIAWTILISAGIGGTLGVVLGRQHDGGTAPNPSALAVVVRGISVIFIANIVQTILVYSDRLTNVAWPTLVVTTPPVGSGLGSLPEILTVNGFLVAAKWAIPPALVASTAVIPTAYRIGRRGIAQITDGLPKRVRLAVGGPATSQTETRSTLLVWLLESLPGIVGLIIVSSLIAETYFRAGSGLTRILAASVLGGEPALLAGLTMVVFLPIAAADIIREVGIYWVTGVKRRRRETVAMFSVPSATTVITRLQGMRRKTGRLRRSLSAPTGGRVARVRANPRPALGWVLVGTALILLELGAIRDVLMIQFPSLTLPKFPTLISQTTIPDTAHQTPAGDWTGAFLGLSPGLAWAARILIAAGYVTALFTWAWLGVRLARVVYGDSDADILAGTTVRLLRDNDRLRIGLLIVVIIGSVGVFSPAIAPSMSDNPDAEFSDQTVTYLNPETGEIEEVLMIQVVADMDPDGSPAGTPGLLEYDDYGRFHPVGVSLQGLPGTEPGARTYDIFTNLAVNLQAIVRLVGLTTLLTLAMTLVVGSLVVHSRVVDQVLARVSDGLLLVPVFLLAVFTYRIPGPGDTGTQAFAAVGLRREDPQMPWFRQPEFGLHHVVLALLATLVLIRVVRRIAATRDTDDFRATMRDAAVPVLGHALMLMAGVVLIVVIGRLLRFEHPTASLGFDIRVPLDFLWLDTALWYRHTVPMLVQFSLGIGLALVGDGLREASDDRADPESHAPTETNAGGGGG